MSHDADYNSLFDSENQVNEAEDKVVVLEQENAALKAMVNSLRESLGNVVLMEQNNSGYEPSLSCFQRSISEAVEVLTKADEQCLADVKADALLKFADCHKELFKDMTFYCGDGDEESDVYLLACEWVDALRNQSLTEGE